MEVPRRPTAAQTQEQLRRLQRANVTVVVGCTYYDEGVAILEALEALDFSPMAVMVAATVDTPSFSHAVKGASGLRFWQGEYALGYAPWHSSRSVRGAFSGMTSAEFVSEYEAKFGETVPYQGVAQFAAAAALADAIQRAGTLDTHAVAAQLRARNSTSTALSEFYGELAYDEHGQMLVGAMPVLQYLPPPTDDVRLVYPTELSPPGVGLVFPMPSWAERRCRVFSRGLSSGQASAYPSGLECFGHGTCADDGACVCDAEWQGTYCQDRLSGIPIVNLGGLFPFFAVVGTNGTADVLRDDASGRLRAAAFLLAIAELNNKTDGIRDALVPETILRIALGDSRRDVSSASVAATHLIHETFDGEGVSAIVGPASSGPAEQVTTLAAMNAIPQISYSATSVTLSEGTGFFLRSVPSDAFQVIGLCEILRNLFDSPRIGVLASTDSYSTALLATFREQAAVRSLELVIEQTFTPLATAADDSLSLAAQLQALRRSSARYILLFCSGADAGPVLVAAHEAGVLDDQYVWLGADAVISPSVISHVEQVAPSIRDNVLRGLFGLLPHARIGSADHASFVERLGTWLAEQNSSTTANGCSDAKEGALWGSPDEGCYLWARATGDVSAALACDDPSIERVCVFPSAELIATDAYSVYAYDATIALAHAIHSLIAIGATSIDGRALMSALTTDVSFVGLSGTLSFFDRPDDPNLRYHGDRQSGVSYNLMNYQGAGAFATSGEWTFCDTTLCDWAQQWIASNQSLTFHDGSSRRPDQDALLPCSALDRVGLCVSTPDGDVLQYVRLQPAQCTGASPIGLTGGAPHWCDADGNHTAHSRRLDSHLPDRRGGRPLPQSLLGSSPKLVLEFRVVDADTDERVNPRSAAAASTQPDVTMQLRGSNHTEDSADLDGRDLETISDGLYRATIPIDFLGALDLTISFADTHGQHYNVTLVHIFTSVCAGLQVPDPDVRNRCVCQAGSEPAEPATGPEPCSLCLPGSFKGGGGNSFCAPCDQGTYAEGAGELSCSSCQPLTHTADRGSTSCTQCDATRNSTIGSTSCDFCRARYYSPLVGVECLPCSSLDGARPDCAYGSTVANICILPDYWRLSNRTATLSQCQPNGPCMGGCEVGGYCLPGHTGPLCEACVDDDHYYDIRTSRCTVCPSAGVAATRAIAVCLILLAIFGIFQLVTRKLHCSNQNVYFALLRGALLKLQGIVGVLGLTTKFKIVVSFMQVFTVISTVYDVTLPPGYRDALDNFEFLNFGFDILLPSRCISTDFTDVMLFYALMPLGIEALVLTVAVVRVKCHSWQRPVLVGRLGLRWRMPAVAKTDHGGGAGISSAASETVGPEASCSSTSVSPSPLSFRRSMKSLQISAPAGAPSASSEGSFVKRQDNLERARGERIISVAVNIVLLISFCFCPTVSRIIFNAWSCDSFTADEVTEDTWAFLRADLWMRCSFGDYTNPEHSELKVVSAICVVIWPVLVPVVWAVLLFKARSAIQARKPTLLSLSTRILWKGYKAEASYWEAFSLLQKLALTGFVLLIDNSKILQRQFAAVILSCLFCVVLIAQRPYKAGTDNILAIGSQLVLLAVFMAVFMMQICGESVEMCTALGFSSADEIATVFLAGLAIMLLVVIGTIVVEINRSSALLAIRVVATRQEPELMLQPTHSFHLFLSHYWNTAQDQVALIKRQLNILVPTAQIFLDVDDMESVDELERYIDETAVVLCFLSAGYFRSAACQREIRHALLRRKPILLVRETDDKHGAIPLSTLRSECPEDCRAELYTHTMVPWFRVREFQLCSLKAIVQHIFTASPSYARMLKKPLTLRDDSGRRSSEEAQTSRREDGLAKLYIPGELEHKRMVFASPVLLAYSEHNPGARQVAEEIKNGLRYMGQIAIMAHRRQQHKSRRLWSVIHTCKQLGTAKKASTAQSPTTRAKNALERISRCAATPASAARSSRVDEVSVLSRPWDEVSVLSSNVKHDLRKQYSESLRHAIRMKRGLSNELEVEPEPESSVTEDADARGRQEHAGASPTARQSMARRRWRDSMASVLQDLPRPKKLPIGAAESAASEEQYTDCLLYLNDQTFMGPAGVELSKTVRSWLLNGARITMLHECDDQKGAVPFEHFFEVTPRDLIVAGLYGASLAVPLVPGIHYGVSLALTAIHLGAQAASRGCCGCGPGPAGGEVDHETSDFRRETERKIKLGISQRPSMSTRRRAPNPERSTWA